MDKELDLEALSQKVADDFKAADQARAYAAITAEHGPSQQLIDFINFDGKLGEEIGLEGWSNFSTTTQHEILLSKLHPDTTESVALEGFLDFVKKYRAWLLVGGFVIPVLWVGAIAGYVKAYKELKLPKYNDFVSVKKDLADAMSLGKQLVSKTPSSTKDTDWAKFDKEASDIYNKISAVAEEDTFEFVSGEQSGWTPEKFSESAKFLDRNADEYEKLCKSYSSKLSTIESFASSKKDDDKYGATVKAMNSSISETRNSFKKIATILVIMRTLLNHTAKGFEFDKKKEA